MKKYEMYYIILNDGMGEKLLKLAKEEKIRAATVCYGRGSITNTFLNLIGVYDKVKEVVMIAEEKCLGDKFLIDVANQFSLMKSNKGIAFATPLLKVYGGNKECGTFDIAEEEMKTMKHHLITTVVERGSAELVVESAVKAGAKGATILNGRGSNLCGVDKLLSLDVGPEKDIVLILSKEETTDLIASAIRADMKIDENGRGIIFITGVSEVFGSFGQMEVKCDENQ